MKLRTKQTSMGREAAQWVAKGCNWAPGPELEATKRIAARVLKNPQALRDIGRKLSRFGGYGQSVATAAVINDQQWLKELCDEPHM